MSNSSINTFSLLIVLSILDCAGIYCTVYVLCNILLKFLFVLRCSLSVFCGCMIGHSWLEDLTEVAHITSPSYAAQGLSPERLTLTRLASVTPTKNQYYFFV
jgi:hypothetical protein